MKILVIAGLVLGVYVLGWIAVSVISLQQDVDVLKEMIVVGDGE